MPLYRFDISLSAPLATSITGPSLWGHAVWAIAESRGVEEAGKVISLCRDGAPPFVFGDALPAGYLPRPILPTEKDGLATFVAGADVTPEKIEELKVLKSIRKRQWIRKQSLCDIINSPLSDKRILKKMIRDGEGDPDLGLSEVLPHVALSRTSNSSIKGKLFEEEATFFDPKTETHLSVYGWTEENRARAVEELLKLVGTMGFGANASTGRGQFSVVRAEPVTWDVGKPNALLALGSFFPASSDPTKGWWNVRTHYGRVSNRLMQKMKTLCDLPATPFKKPQILLTPGTVLLGTERPFLGSLLENVHRLPGVVDAAFCPTLPINVANEEEK